MAETSTPGSSGTDYKTRRPHRKSRNGCTKCKERRIKCDELTPRCTRCGKMNLPCQYPRRHTGVLASEDCWIVEPIGSLLQRPQKVSRAGSNGEVGSPGSSDHSSAIAGSPLSSTSSVPGSYSTSLLPGYGRGFDFFSVHPQIAQTLAPTESDLLKHYLEHTSSDPTVGAEDQYTLQVGIPNLACQSKPLMKSVLALAAVCKCSDLINQPTVTNVDRGQVVELLELAQQYHMESLHEIQSTLPEAKQYDHVLANAAMMGMYGSASHCTRIWLAKTAPFGDQRLDHLVPRFPQWVGLFRAVRLAYVGLLNNRLRLSMSPTDLTSTSSPASSPCDPVAGSHLQMQYEYKVPSRRDPGQHPPNSVNHALYPILAGTVGSALAKLHDKAREISIIHASSAVLEPESLANPIYGDLEVCYTALTIFSDIVNDTFPAGDPMPSMTSQTSNINLDIDIEPMGQLSEVSPWLRRYTASITSMTPSRLPRRTIMAFIHKAPTRYLNLIEETVSLLQTEPPAEEDAWGMASPRTPDPSVAHQLALDIFAHWLVLVILLENVWWIGGIGAWELGQIVAARKDMRWRMCMWNKDKDWWPESMFEVSRQFDKHR